MIEINDIKLSLETNDTEIEDIKRCLKTLYETREGTQPLDRKFGLNIDFSDKPMPVAQNELALEIIKKTAIYEKRVTVKQVTYEHDKKEGKLIPIVYLTGRED